MHRTDCPFKMLRYPKYNVQIWALGDALISAKNKGQDLHQKKFLGMHWFCSWIFWQSKFFCCRNGWWRRKWWRCRWRFALFSISIFKLKQRTRIFLWCYFLTCSDVWTSKSLSCPNVSSVFNPSFHLAEDMEQVLDFILLGGAILGGSISFFCCVGCVFLALRSRVRSNSLFPQIRDRTG